MTLLRWEVLWGQARLLPHEVMVGIHRNRRSCGSHPGNPTDRQAPPPREGQREGHRVLIRYVPVGVHAELLRLIYLFVCFCERAGGRGRERGRERKFQAGSPLFVRSTTWGLIPIPCDHDLRRTQESDAQPTESPRCSKAHLWISFSKFLPRFFFFLYESI